VVPLINQQHSTVHCSSLRTVASALCRLSSAAIAGIAIVGIAIVDRGPLDVTIFRRIVEAIRKGEEWRQRCLGGLDHMSTSRFDGTSWYEDGGGGAELRREKVSIIFCERKLPYYFFLTLWKHHGEKMVDFSIFGATLFAVA